MYMFQFKYQRMKADAKFDACSLIKKSNRKKK